MWKYMGFQRSWKIEAKVFMDFIFMREHSVPELQQMHLRMPDNIMISQARDTRVIQEICRLFLAVTGYPGRQFIQRDFILKKLLERR